ncbi:MAG: RAMP superfamily CRISPR-associated protein [Rivularia sp. ALOHA_DT_140]|nr:RAMP superfamily CRISPR-associated protein [Rivularia sp. ALOHA_DT_140]
MSFNRNNPRNNYSSKKDEMGPKPYELIPFPNKPITPKSPPGHSQYLPNRLHGTLYLTLFARTSLHISTGSVVMGNDIGEKPPLVKTMVKTPDNKLIIQGSSLKGCIRSIYEAITNSRLGVTSRKYEQYYPKERSPKKNSQNKLCPASLVFGASGEGWGWQSLIDFQDAICEQIDYKVGFIPNLWSAQPKKRKAYFNKGETAGRKFYYHMAREIDKGRRDGIPIQQIKQAYFKTKIQFHNLQPQELGTLLVILGQDSEYPLGLKLGGGKPIGMGTIIIDITKANISQNPEDLRQRYSSYSASSQTLTGEKLKTFIQENIEIARKNLIENTQLQAIYEILGHRNKEITRQPYELY